MGKVNKNSAQMTTAGSVIGVLQKHHAYSEKTAIDISKFKDLEITSDVIAYTIANLMQDDVIIKTSDNKYYFSEENYQVLKSNVNKAYRLLVGIPFAVIVILFIVKNWEMISNFLKNVKL